MAPPIMTKRTTVTFTNVKIFVKVADERTPNPNRTTVNQSINMIKTIPNFWKNKNIIYLPERARVIVREKKSQYGDRPGALMGKYCSNAALIVLLVSASRLALKARATLAVPKKGFSFCFSRFIFNFVHVFMQPHQSCIQESGSNRWWKRSSHRPWHKYKCRRCQLLELSHQIQHRPLLFRNNR